MKEYIYIALEDDDEIIDFFDPNIPVSSPREAAERIYQKLLANYPGAEFRPLKYEGQEIGYFAWLPGLLISFGVNIHYRKKKVLTAVWDMITETIGTDFSCILYTRNRRAINWLQRCGMQVFGENLTLLLHTKKSNVCQQADCSA